MAASRKLRRRAPAASPEPGRPARRRGPEAADVAAEYLDAPRPEERSEQIDGDDLDLAGGSVDDQRIYERLEENRTDGMPPLADPKRGRQRSPVAARSAPAPGKPAKRGRSSR